MSIRDAAAANNAVDLLDQVNARIREFRAIRDELLAANATNSQLVQQITTIRDEITARRNEIASLIASNLPAHEWDGTKLRLMNPDGGWGEWVDLAGAQGSPGNPGPPGDPGDPGGLTEEYVAKYNAVLAAQDDVGQKAASITAIFATLAGPPRTIEETTYTLVAGDKGRTLRFPNGCTVTLPADLGDDFYAVLSRPGTAAVTWVAGAGATKHEYPQGAGVAAQFTEVFVKVDKNPGNAAEWWIQGAIK